MNDERGSVNMKAVIVFCSNKILFWHADNQIKEYIPCFASQSNDNFECSDDSILQTFLPFLASYDVYDEARNTYELISLENGLAFTCHQFDLCKDILYMVITDVSGDSPEKEYFVQRELHILYQLSLAVHGLIPRSNVESDELRWISINEMLQFWLLIISKEQGLLFHSIERLLVNDTLSAACINILEYVMTSFKTAGIKGASHSFLIVKEKLLALWSSPHVSQLSSEDILLLILAGKYMFGGHLEHSENEQCWKKLTLFLQKGTLAHKLYACKIFPSMYLLVLATDCYLDAGLSLVQLARFCDSDDKSSPKISSKDLGKMLKTTMEQLKLVKVSDTLSAACKEFTEDVYSINCKQLTVRIYKLFRTIFHTNHNDHVPSNLSHIQSYVREELIDYEKFIEYKSFNNMDMNVFSKYRAKGLLHFIFINRDSDQMISPSFTDDSLSSRRKSKMQLKELIWSQLPVLRAKLGSGYHNVMMKYEKYYISYFLCFEDPMGNFIELANRKSNVALPVTGHEFFWQWLYDNTNGSLPDVHGYELMCIHSANTPPSLICTHARELAKKLWELTNPCNSLIGVM